MKTLKHPKLQSEGSSSTPLAAQRSGHFVRHMLGTLLALLATTSLAHAGWSTVTCTGGEQMCCWVEDGVESNCHDGPCHTLQEDSGLDEMEENEGKGQPDSRGNRHLKEVAKVELPEEGDRRLERTLMEVVSADDVIFCIDLRTMRAKGGPCPDAARVRVPRGAETYREETTESDPDPLTDRADEDDDNEVDDFTDVHEVSDERAAPN